ncbi:MAG: hypothetical protein ACPGWM_09370 [Flavobacteriales bacterium]
MKKISYVLLLMSLVFLSACKTEEEKTVHSFIEGLDHAANKALWKTMINTNPNIDMNNADVAIEVSYLRVKEIKAICASEEYTIEKFVEGKSCGYHLQEQIPNTQVYCVESEQGCAVIQLTEGKVTSITPLVSSNAIMRWY